MIVSTSVHPFLSHAGLLTGTPQYRILSESASFIVQWPLSTWILKDFQLPILTLELFTQMPVTEYINHFFPPDKSTAISEVYQRSKRLLFQIADISMTLIQKRLLEIQNTK